SFGRTYLLSKYSHNLLNDEKVNSEAITFSGRLRELAQIQDILARPTGANAFLQGEQVQRSGYTATTAIYEALSKYPFDRVQSQRLTRSTQ
ncbi:MAG: hypothetical protein WCG12_20990, partial [Alcaligenaceae bacterium]